MLSFVHTATISIWEEIKAASTNDTYIIVVSNQVVANPHDSYSWHEGLFSYKGRVIVPANKSIRTKLLHEFHDSKLEGHSKVLHK